MDVRELGDEPMKRISRRTRELMIQRFGKNFDIWARQSITKVTGLAYCTWLATREEFERSQGMHIRIQTKVKELIEKEITTGGKKDKDDKAVLSYEKVGWFVHFEGSYEALFVGREKPEGLEAGTEVDILIMPREK